MGKERLPVLLRKECLIRPYTIKHCTSDLSLLIATSPRVASFCSPVFVTVVHLFVLVFSLLLYLRFALSSPSSTRLRSRAGHLFYFTLIPLLLRSGAPRFHLAALVMYYLRSRVHLLHFLYARLQRLTWQVIDVFQPQSSGRFRT